MLAADDFEFEPKFLFFQLDMKPDVIRKKNYTKQSGWQWHHLQMNQIQPQT